MTIDDAAVKGVHVAAAATSLALFVLRAAWMLASPARLRIPWVRIVPHCVDTVLLASALWLAWQLGADGTRGWLIAKVIGVTKRTTPRYQAGNTEIPEPAARLLRLLVLLRLTVTTRLGPAVIYR